MKALVASTAAAVVGVLAPPAGADAVYHTDHLALSAVGGAPLRSGFVQNIKANGPQIYAHELFVLNGAAPRADYNVTRNFFFFDTECGGEPDFRSSVGQLETNHAGNARQDVFVRPDEIPAFLVGDDPHGVRWTVTDRAGKLAYQTACAAVTLD
jgi:hypothetical protein